MLKPTRNHCQRRLRLESLEERRMLDCSAEPIAALPDVLVTACAGEIAGAADVPISVDGSVKFTGDQIRVFFSVSPGSDDKRIDFVLDTAGFFRPRHPDADQPPGSEDGLGTSLVLGPTLILNDGGPDEDFNLRQAITAIDIDTSDVAAGRFRLTATGSPASAAGPLGGATVNWTITIPLSMPFDPSVENFDATRVQIDTAVTFSDEIVLSQGHLNNAEAFRAITFSSSNVPAENTSLDVRTHDADQLAVTGRDGAVLREVDLNTASHNQLLFPAGMDFDGTLALNQLEPAPLNGDPPNVSVAIHTQQDISHQAQGFITLNESTDEDSDNVGVWISRPFSDRTVPAGTHLTWRLDILASDDVSPPRYTNLAGRLDTSGDRQISPIDALLVINELNAGGARRLTDFPDFPLLDTSADGVLSPIDALLVINHLNQPTGLAEAESSASVAQAGDMVFAAWEPVTSQPAGLDARTSPSPYHLANPRSRTIESAIPLTPSIGQQGAAASDAGSAMANQANRPFASRSNDDFFASLGTSWGDSDDIAGQEWLD